MQVFLLQKENYKIVIKSSIECLIVIRLAKKRNRSNMLTRVWHRGQ